MKTAEIIASDDISIHLHVDEQDRKWVRLTILDERGDRAARLVMPVERLRWLGENCLAMHQHIATGKP